MLDAAGNVPRTRVTVAGMALVDAQLLAAMRRTIANDHVEFDLRPYRTLAPPRSKPSTRPPEGTAVPPARSPAHPAVTPALRPKQRGSGWTHSTP